MKRTTTNQRKNANKWLSDYARTHTGAAEISRYFIATAPWPQLVEAHKIIKEGV